VNNAKSIGKAALIGAIAFLTGVVPGLGFALLGLHFFGWIGWAVGMLAGMSMAYYLGGKIQPMMSKLSA